MRIDKAKVKEILDEELAVFEAVGKANVKTTGANASATDVGKKALVVGDPVASTASKVAGSASKVGKGLGRGVKGLGPLAVASGAHSLYGDIKDPTTSKTQKAARVTKDVADIGMGLAGTPGVASTLGLGGTALAGAPASAALTAGGAAPVAAAGLAGYELGKGISKAIGSRLGPESEYAKQAGKGVTDVDYTPSTAAKVAQYALTGKSGTGGTQTGPPKSAGGPQKALRPGDKRYVPGKVTYAESRQSIKSIDFIKKLVEQELREIDGGIMDPNMVPFVPHREPAADPPKESEEEDTEVDRLYRIAVKARLATEALVEALDDPIYDQAYDNAFKATMALRDSLNSLIDQGAKPLDSEQLVAPPEADQPRQDAPGYAIPFAGITYSGDNV